MRPGHRHRRPNCVLCAAAIVLMIVGMVWLCCLSYRFLLMSLAALFIVVGLLLKKNC